MAGRWALLSRVPQTASTPIDFTASAPPLPPADLTTDALSADAPPPPPFILHTLARSDTLIGLSFKYRVSEHDIRRLNDLPSDNLFTGGPTLRIPTSAMPRGMSAREAVPADTRAAVLRRFRVENGLEDSEARFYLDDSDWDPVAAKRALARDLTFEQNNAAAASRAVADASRGGGAAAASRLSGGASAATRLGGGALAASSRLGGAQHGGALAPAAAAPGILSGHHLSSGSGEAEGDDEATGVSSALLGGGMAGGGMQELRRRRFEG